MSIKKIITVLGIAIVIVFGYISYADAVSTGQKLQEQQHKIENLNIKYEKTTKELDKAIELKTNSQEEVKKLEQEKKLLDEERQKLQNELQARADAKANLAAAANSVINQVTLTSTVSATSGSHYDLVVAAGISASDFQYVDYIVMREGSYNPCIVNGGAIDCNYAINGGQKAYGTCQSLPGKKMASAGSDWATNTVTQLRWCNSYALARYGSWANAYAFWLNNKYW